MRKRFTLVEVIAILVVIAVIAGIVIPNIGNIQGGANRTAITSNARGIQTAVDLFGVATGGAVPTSTPPTVFVPQRVDFSLLEETHLRGSPQAEQGKYWVDFSGRVWAASVDAPDRVVSVGGVVAWRAVPGAVGYVVYEVSGSSPTGSLSGITLTPVAETTSTFYVGAPGNDYVVSAVDSKGLQTVPVGPGFTNEVALSVGEPILPIAVLSADPATGVNTDIPVLFSSERSISPDGGLIVEQEWTLNGQVLNWGVDERLLLPVGENQATLRVRNEAGVWSLPASQTVSVIMGNLPPVAVIGMTPSADLTMGSVIEWSSAGSSDPDGHVIANAEWENVHATYAIGTHTVRLRVQDSFGHWSPWVEHTFVVGNRPPVAIPVMTPDAALDTDTVVVWSHLSTDPDAHEILAVEWVGTQETYPVGTHTVGLRVQDSFGDWSPWAEKTFSVVAANLPPTAVIGMTPETYIDAGTVIAWDHLGSTDPEGHALTAEWDNMHASYAIGTHTVRLRVQDSLGLWSPWVERTFTVGNRIPMAVPVMTPAAGITNETPVVWTHASTDPDGHAIAEVQWTNALTTFPVGPHTVTLRVRDSFGDWSTTASISFTVTQANRAPTAVIGMTPGTDINAGTVITWNHSGSTDPDGHLLSAEWQNRHSSYAIGTHTVRLRVQDSPGLWSPWVERTFTVANRIPIAVPVMTPATGITNETPVVWTHASTDPDGHAIAEVQWTNALTTFPVGPHTVTLRVRDSFGDWSPVSSISFTVTQANRAPTAVIGMTPGTDINAGTVITWNHSGSTDPDGHLLTAEWQNRHASYAIGTHTVRLRVQDSLGLWSPWVERTFTVANRLPIAVIGMTPSSGITPSTSVSWTHASSFDPDGHAVVLAQWTGTQATYTAGTHTVTLRVQDSLGAWSPVSSISFTVTAPNRPPKAVIGMSPSSGLTTDSWILWTEAGSWDPDGHSIIRVEWSNRNSRYPAGTHGVSLRVQDSQGLWSPWTTIWFTVNSPPPIWEEPDPPAWNPPPPVQPAPEPVQPAPEPVQPAPEPVQPQPEPPQPQPEPPPPPPLPLCIGDICKVE